MSENEPVVQSFKRRPQKRDRDFDQKQYRDLRFECQRLALEIRGREREKK